MIEISQGGTAADSESAALAVPVLADRAWGPGAAAAAESLGDWLTGYLDEHDFQGKAGEVVAVPGGGDLSFTTVYFVGLGSDPTTESLRSAAGSLGRKASRAVSVATTLHAVAVDDAAAAVAAGFALGQYRFDKYRSEPKPARTATLELLEADEAAVAAAERDPPRSRPG